MKEIIIKIENKDIINQIIKEAEGKARRRCISYDDIKEAITAIEAVLKLPKKYMNGIAYNVDVHAQKFANAYHGRPESTQFAVVYRNGSWRLKGVARDYCNNTSYVSHYCTYMPDATRDYLINRMVKEVSSF